MTEPRFFLVPMAKGPLISLNAGAIVFMAPAPEGSQTIVELISGKQILVEKPIHELVPGYPKPSGLILPTNDLPADRP